MNDNINGDKDLKTAQDKGVDLQRLVRHKPAKTHKCTTCGFEDRCWSWIGVPVQFCVKCENGTLLPLNNKRA